MMPRIFACLLCLSLALPILWLAGISTIDLARALLGLTLVAFAISHYQGRLAAIQETANPLATRLWPSMAMIAWVGAVLIIDAVALYFREFSFSLGFDHGIFMQAAHSFSEKGELLTSFNLGGWQSFLNDHFSPYLAVPGALVYLGLSPNVAIIIIHLLSFALAALAMLKISKLVQGSYGLGILAVFIMFCFPNYRHMLSWGTDIEYFGLPFILWAWWAFLSSRHGLTIGLLLLSWLCKESLTSISVAFCLMAIIETKATKHRLWYGTLALVGTLWFFLYTIGHHHLFGEPYAHIGRIALVDTLSQPLVQLQKLYPYAITGLIVLLVNPALRHKLWLTLPAWPPLAMVVISSKPEMADFVTHYSLPPVMFLLTAALACPKKAEELSFWRQYQLDLPHRSAFGGLSLALVVALLFTTSNRRPVRSIYAGMTSQLELPDYIGKLDQSKAAIVSMGAVPHLLGTFELINTPMASDALPNIDYAIVLQSDKKVLHPTTVAQLKPCHEDADWLILCRRSPTGDIEDSQ